MTDYLLEISFDPELDEVVHGHVFLTRSIGSMTRASWKDIESFFATHPAGSGTRSLRRSMEAIDTCLAFRNAQQASFEKAIQ